MVFLIAMAIMFTNLLKETQCLLRKQQNDWYIKQNSVIQSGFGTMSPALAGRGALFLQDVSERYYESYFGRCLRNY